MVQVPDFAGSGYDVRGRQGIRLAIYSARSNFQKDPTDPHLIFVFNEMLWIVARIVILAQR